MKTLYKTSNRFKSYSNFNEYANFSNVEKIDVTINIFLSHKAAFYDVIGGIKI